MPPSSKRKSSLFNNLLTQAQQREPPPRQSHFFHYSPPPPITQKQAIEQAIIHDGLSVTSLFHLQAAPISRRARPQSRKVSRLVQNPTEQAAHVAARAVAEQERLRRIHTEDALQIVKKRASRSNGKRPTIRPSSSDDDEVVRYFEPDEPSPPPLIPRRAVDDDPSPVIMRRRPPRQPSVRLPPELPSSPERAGKSTRVSKSVSSPVRHNAEMEQKAQHVVVRIGNGENIGRVDKHTPLSKMVKESPQGSGRKRGKVDRSIVQKPQDGRNRQGGGIALEKRRARDGEDIAVVDVPNVKRSLRPRKLVDEKDPAVSDSLAQNVRSRRRSRTRGAKPEGLDSDVSTEIAAGLDERTHERSAPITPPLEEEREICAQPPSAQKLARSNKPQKTRRRVRSRPLRPVQLDDSDTSVIDLTEDTEPQRFGSSSKNSVETRSYATKSLGTAVSTSPIKGHRSEERRTSWGNQKKYERKERFDRMSGGTTSKSNASSAVREKTKDASKIMSAKEGEVPDGGKTQVSEKEEAAAMKSLLKSLPSPPRKRRCPVAVELICDLSCDRDASATALTRIQNQNGTEQLKAVAAASGFSITGSAPKEVGAPPSPAKRSESKSVRLPPCRGLSSNERLLRSAETDPTSAYTHVKSPPRRTPARRSNSNIDSAGKPESVEKVLAFSRPGDSQGTPGEIVILDMDESDNPLTPLRVRSSSRRRGSTKQSTNESKAEKKSIPTVKQKASPTRRRSGSSKKRPKSQRKEKKGSFPGLVKEEGVPIPMRGCEANELGPQSMSIGCDDVPLVLSSFSKRLQSFESEEVLDGSGVPHGEQAIGALRQHNSSSLTTSRTIEKDAGKYRLGHPNRSSNGGLQKERLVTSEDGRRQTPCSGTKIAESATFLPFHSPRRKRNRQAEVDEEMVYRDGAQKKVPRLLETSLELKDLVPGKVYKSQVQVLSTRRKEKVKLPQLGKPFGSHVVSPKDSAQALPRKRRVSPSKSAEPGPKAPRKEPGIDADSSVGDPAVRNGWNQQVSKRTEKSSDTLSSKEASKRDFTEQDESQSQNVNKQGEVDGSSAPEGDKTKRANLQAEKRLSAPAEKTAERSAQGSLSLPRSNRTRAWKSFQPTARSKSDKAVDQKQSSASGSSDPLEHKTAKEHILKPDSKRAIPSPGDSKVKDISALTLTDTHPSTSKNTCLGSLKSRQERSIRSDEDATMLNPEGRVNSEDKLLGEEAVQVKSTALKTREVKGSPTKLHNPSALCNDKKAELNDSRTSEGKGCYKSKEIQNCMEDFNTAEAALTGQALGEDRTGEETNKASPSVLKSPLGSKRVRSLRGGDVEGGALPVVKPINSPTDEIESKVRQHLEEILKKEGKKDMPTSPQTFRAQLFRSRSAVAIMKRPRTKLDADLEDFPQSEVVQHENQPKAENSPTCASPLPTDRKAKESPMRSPKKSPRKSVQGSPIRKKLTRSTRELSKYDLLFEERKTAEASQWDSGMAMDLDESEFIDIKKPPPELQKSRGQRSILQRRQSGKSSKIGNLFNHR